MNSSAPEKKVQSNFLFGPKSTEVAATGKAKEDLQPAKKVTVGFLSGINLAPNANKAADLVKQEPSEPAKKKRPIKELLAEYERKRIEYDKENELGRIIGSDGNIHENLT